MLHDIRTSTHSVLAAMNDLVRFLSLRSVKDIDRDIHFGNQSLLEEVRDTVEEIHEYNSRTAPPTQHDPTVTMTTLD